MRRGHVFSPGMALAMAAATGTLNRDEAPQYRRRARIDEESVFCAEPEEAQAARACAQELFKQQAMEAAQKRRSRRAAKRLKGSQP